MLLVASMHLFDHFKHQSINYRDVEPN